MEALDGSDSKTPVSSPTPDPVREAKVDPTPKMWRATPVNAALWLATGLACGFTVSVLRGSPFTPMGYFGIVLAISALFAQWTIYSRRPIPSTIRKSIRRLPVLRGDGVQRIGALVGVAATTCGRCAHFDLPAGQEMLKHHSFGMATASLAPSQMARTAKGGWKEENGFDSTGRPIEDPESKDRWHELGACTLKQIGVFAPQSCKDWA